MAVDYLHQKSLNVNDLERFSTSDLEEELRKRRKTDKEKQDAALKDSEISVRCNFCGGSGENSEEKYDSYGYKCLNCNGTGTVKAYRVQQ
jgi:DnaJ-class molecular chaperone